MGLIEQRFREWTQGKNVAEVRVNIYRKIRDIPYAVIPELVDAERYADILKIQKGSCTPKHFLLCNMYQRLGMLVLYAIYPFRWDDSNLDYPSHLKRLAEELPISHHLACRVEINGKLVLVDATLDVPLEKAGLTVNREWDGISDTLLAMNPLGEEQLYHPSEAYLLKAQYNKKQLIFYHNLNSFLEGVRNL